MFEIVPNTHLFWWSFGLKIGVPAPPPFMYGTSDDSGIATWALTSDVEYVESMASTLSLEMSFRASDTTLFWSDRSSWTLSLIFNFLSPSWRPPASLRCLTARS